MLLCIIWSFILADLGTWRVVESQPESAFCIGTECYGLFHSHQNFRSAKKICSANVSEGHLMTVRSTVAADIILLLTGNSRKHFWIGLSLANGVCTDNSNILRGFRWVTGDDKTDFSSWKTHSTECGPSCSFVTNGTEWGAKPCSEKADGFLCEYNYNGMCFQVTAPDQFRVTYITPFGAKDSDLQEYPPATVASVYPTRDNFTCTDQGDGTFRWKSLQKAPWDCLVENGGCEYQCESHGGSPRCLCPSSQYLMADGLSCSPQPDPCKNVPCAHICIPQGNGFMCMCRDGYNLTADGVTCEDVDDCKMNSRPCDQQCTNLEGGFKCSCYEGYEMLNDNSCRDIDECALDGTCDHFCNNTAGSFACFCNEGYVKDATDPKKCNLFCDTETCPAVCDPNNYKCKCPDGYVLDDDKDGNSICIDIDNCDGTNFCQQLCENTFGSYKCSCKEGYTLKEDGTSCKSEWEEETGSAGAPTFTVPSITRTSVVIPTTNYTAVHIALSPGAIVGILIVSTVVIFVFIIGVYCVIKQRSKWALSKDTKCGTDRDISLQEVTAADSCAHTFIPSTEKSKLDT
ncbi:thrombomodulin [Protopterus annectens]|uniref:thrombomodulin n=1 Tax=Protopterus annectens TaxID=7888 RepID=UPI001CFBED28|nr:thrombomodulin [Protopterus annectens]